MFVRRIVHTLCGVVLLGVLATSATGAMMDTRRTTHFTFSGTVQFPGVDAAGRHLHLRSGESRWRFRHRPGAEPRSEDGASPAVHAHHLSCLHGQSQGDRLTRRNSCWHPSTCESVVSAIRDPRPRVHLLTTTPLPPPCLTLASCTAGQPFFVHRSTVCRLPFAVRRSPLRPFTAYRGPLFSASIAARTVFKKPVTTAFTSEISFAHAFRSDSASNLRSPARMT